MAQIVFENLFETLLSFPTINEPGNELPAAHYLKDVLDSLGFSTIVQTVEKNRGNVIGTIGPESATQSLMLTGHIDVVGVEDGWESDPFILTKKGTRYVGRGVADMKGAIACMIMAAQSFLATNPTLKRKLILAFTADEEVGGAGARYMLEHGSAPTYAIIGEPTEMQMHIAHRGVNHYGVTIKGLAGHASKPQNCLNPLYPAAKFLSAIENLQESLKEKTHFILPSPTVTANIVHSGVQWNAVPDICQIEVDRRTIPGETMEFVEQEVNELLAPLKKEYPKYQFEHTYLSGIPYNEPREDNGLRQYASDVLTDIGIDSITSYFPAGCDQYQFSEKGTDCILLGPGSIAQGHTTNEYIEIDQLEKAKEFYQGLIEKIVL